MSDLSTAGAKVGRGRVLVKILIALLAVIFLVSLVFCVGTPHYYGAKYSPTTVRVASWAVPSEWTPERQTEGHTCGFHALSSIYRAYGLDPGAMRLRFRLGTDRRATNLDSESLGTIHPDILRVLDQDGFDATTLVAIGDGSAEQIRDHLKSGHPVLALIRVSDLHWIVLTAIDGDDVVVCDSLRSELACERFDDYVRERVLSAILIRPKE
ncbi:MAG: hypothetical protein AB7Q00_14915 [Phycisphaerales bacterium]